MEFIVLEDSLGNQYDLSSSLIAFGEVTLTEEAKVAVILHNIAGEPVENVQLQCLAHPTAQVGKAQDTYDATEISLDELTGYVKILDIPYMSTDEKVIIWLRWTIPATAIPGYGQFAIKVTGEMIL